MSRTFQARGQCLIGLLALNRISDVVKVLGINQLVLIRNVL